MASSTVLTQLIAQLMGDGLGGLETAGPQTPGFLASDSEALGGPG